VQAQEVAEQVVVEQVAEQVAQQVAEAAQAEGLWAQLRVPLLHPCTKFSWSWEVLPCASLVQRCDVALVEAHHLVMRVRS